MMTVFDPHTCGDLCAIDEELSDQSPCSVQDQTECSAVLEAAVDCVNVSVLLVAAVKLQMSR